MKSIDFFYGGRSGLWSLDNVGIGSTVRLEKGGGGLPVHTDSLRVG